MKNKLFTPTFLSLGFFILLTPFVAFAQETPEPVELKLELREEITENQVKDILQDKDYLITNLKGEVRVGDEIITDFISKGKGEALEDVDELFQEQRQTLLVNMLQAQELSEENSEEMKQQFSREELLTSIRETKNTPVKVKEISVITENQEKAQAIKDSLRSRSEIKDIRESIKEIQTQEIEEKKEVKEENRSLKWLRNTLNFLFAPLRAVANSTPAWVPDFTSIAFFDTDEVGLNPYEDWSNFNSDSNINITDIESHWWRTYIVAEGENGESDKITRFSEEDGSGFEPWRELAPVVPGISNNMINHELVSRGNSLYHFYQMPKVGSLGYAPFRLYVRESLDGGYNWTNPVEVTDHSTAYTATKHNGDICVASEYQDVNVEIQIKCVTNPMTYDWANVTWSAIQDEVYFQGNKFIDMESQFGTLWIAYRKESTGTLEVKSSYDNGSTWNDVMFGDNPQEAGERITGVAEVELTAIGTWNNQNERLCLTADRYDDAVFSYVVNQSCLYRYFDGNGQYNAWNWTPWQKQEIAVQGSGVKSRIETTSDTSRLSMVGTRGDDKFSRTLQYQSNPGRGYISYVRWDEDPGFSEGVIDYTNGGWIVYPGGYEHEVYLNQYDYSLSTNDYNEGQKIYISRNDEGIEYNLGQPNVPYACLPIYNYWASNLPGAYIDTRLDEDGPQTYCDSNLNESGEISFTIGSEFGYQIEEDQYYFTYLNADRGELGKPIFKVQGTQTELRYDDPRTFGYSGAWAAFSTGEPTIKLIYDPFESQIPNSPWINQDDRSTSYPFWYYE
jgi:hypothetical protein